MLRPTQSKAKTDDSNEKQGDNSAGNNGEKNLDFADSNTVNEVGRHGFLDLKTWTLLIVTLSTR